MLFLYSYLFYVQESINSDAGLKAVRFNFSAVIGFARAGSPEPGPAADTQTTSTSPPRH